jgi:heme-degrading monooxygenase HmoA
VQGIAGATDAATHVTKNPAFGPSSTRLVTNAACQDRDGMVTGSRGGYSERMLVVLFRSKLVSDPDGYGEMADEMLATAKTMPGFVDVKSFTAADGERLTVVWWENEETLRAWRTHARHRVAQHEGRARWYEYYTLEVAEIVRSKAFARDAVDG